MNGGRCTEKKKRGSPSTVHRPPSSKKMGRPRVLDEHAQRRLLAMLAMGYSQRRIAKLLKVSRGTVQNELTRAGFRPQAPHTDWEEAPADVRRYST